MRHISVPSFFSSFCTKTSFIKWKTKWSVWE